MSESWLTLQAAAWPETSGKQRAVDCLLYLRLMGLVSDRERGNILRRLNNEIARHAQNRRQHDR